MRVSFVFAVVFGLFAGEASAQSWTIGNGQIRRTLVFSAASGLSTTELSDLSTGTTFIVGARKGKKSAEFSFRCNGRSVRGASGEFSLVGVKEADSAGRKVLNIRLRSKSIPLEVAVIYQVYEGHPAIRKHLAFVNTGQTELRISHLNIEEISPSVGPESETTLSTQYGALPREIFYTGRSDDAALLVANARSGVGFAVMSEVPGYMKRTEIGGWSAPDRVSVGVLYDTDLMPFERSIAPGERFVTANSSFVSFRKGEGFHDPQWVLPSYTAKVLMRRVDASGPPWIYNTWEPFERRINRDTVLNLLEAVSAMGMDIFTIDDGWQREYGENSVDLSAFPGGLESIREAVERKGMRLGLWVPLAAIGTATGDYRKHPEWAAVDQEGKQKITITAAGPKAVMCLATPYRDAAADRINQAIEQFHLAYVKLDLTTIFNTYGEAPGCWAKGHDHKTWSESLNRIYEGISAVTSKIYAKHPEVLLDLTFELWGQKHVIDAGLLAAGDLDWLSNVDDRQLDSAGPIQARTLLYQRAVSMPAESMLIGNLHGNQQSIQERFATAIGSAPLLLGDLRELSPEDRRWYGERISWFKQFRKQTALSESFFPLGSWLQPSAGKWDGFARFARNGNGVIAVFRNKAKEEAAQVTLPLLPEGRYGVRSVITGKRLGTFTEAEWRKGVSLRFSEGGVEVVEVKREGHMAGSER